MRFLWERFISVTEEFWELQVIPWKLQMGRLGFHELKKGLEFENEDFMFRRISSSFDSAARVGSEENEKRRRRRRRRERSLVMNMFWKVQCYLGL